MKKILLAVAVFFLAVEGVPWAGVSELMKAAENAQRNAQRAADVYTLEDMKGYLEAIEKFASEALTEAYDLENNCSADSIGKFISYANNTVSYIKKSSESESFEEAKKYVQRAAEAADHAVEAAQDISYQCK